MLQAWPPHLARKCCVGTTGSCPPPQKSSFRRALVEMASPTVSLKFQGMKDTPRPLLCSCLKGRGCRCPPSCPSTAWFGAPIPRLQDQRVRLFPGEEGMMTKIWLSSGGLCCEQEDGGGPLPCRAWCRAPVSSVSWGAGVILPFLPCPLVVYPSSLGSPTASL